MTVEDNIAFPEKVQRRSAGDIKRRVAEMVEWSGFLAAMATSAPRPCRGQQQRVVRWREHWPMTRQSFCWMNRFPPDKNLRGQMQDEVRRLHRDLGTTFAQDP